MAIPVLCSAKCENDEVTDASRVNGGRDPTPGTTPFRIRNVATELSFALPLRLSFVDVAVDKWIGARGICKQMDGIDVNRRESHWSLYAALHSGVPTWISRFALQADIGG